MIEKKEEAARPEVKTKRPIMKDTFAGLTVAANIIMIIMWRQRAASNMLFEKPYR